MIVTALVTNTALPFSLSMILNKRNILRSQIVAQTTRLVKVKRLGRNACTFNTLLGLVDGTVNKRRMVIGNIIEKMNLVPIHE